MGSNIALTLLTPVASFSRPDGNGQNSEMLQAVSNQRDEHASRMDAQRARQAEQQSQDDEVDFFSGDYRDKMNSEYAARMERLEASLQDWDKMRDAVSNDSTMDAATKARKLGNFSNFQRTLEAVIKSERKIYDNYLATYEKHQAEQATGASGSVADISVSSSTGQLSVQDAYSEF
ncbi:hypothetical protein D8780_15155 [Notoacmeibacter ruber]|uniref:Uncharacterized protein n=2 Tax=Notoacmeibacter ruber TaxID=2670375 RepID=A0A3L7J765_9HYPH|nr:hypothetical protein D8780_15155 [Notoacmeibacter ruber]